MSKLVKLKALLLFYYLFIIIYKFYLFIIYKLCRNQFSSLRTYMEAVLWTNNTFNLPFQNANFVMVIL